MKPDGEIIEAIQAQVRAEMASAEQLRRQNDLAEQALGELRRNRTAEQQRVKLAFDTNDKVSGLLTALEEAFRDLRQIRDKLTEMERQWERTDDILLLLLTEHSPPGKIAESREDLEAEIAERRSSQKKLLKQRYRNFNKLQEREAGYGALDVPLELLNKIENEKQAIEKLEEWLKTNE
jgi:hypothetical protein